MDDSILIIIIESFNLLQLLLYTKFYVDMEYIILYSIIKVLKASK